MDLSAFNKELGIKIARAKALERKDMVSAAIAVWLEISEMALKFSKSRNLDALFKNMIINRTQGIFQHVKNLKNLELSPSEQNTDKSEISVNSEASKKNPVIQSPKQNDITKNSDLKNLSKGFKELKTSTQFKIITPHDDDYVKKRLSQTENMNVSPPNKMAETDEDYPQGQERLEFDQPEDTNNLICFACGTENPLSGKICVNCGISLN